MVVLFAAMGTLSSASGAGLAAHPKLLLILSSAVEPEHSCDETSTAARSGFLEGQMQDLAF